MPRNDDAPRRSARERSQARMGRYDGPSSRPSTDSYGRARQDADDLSQSRYSRQAPRQTSQSSRSIEGASRRPRPTDSSRRSSRDDRASRPDRASDRTRTGRSRPSDGSRRSGSSRSEQQRERRNSQTGRRAPSREDQRRSSRADQRGQQRQPRQAAGIAALLEKLPAGVVPIGIAVLGVIIVLALVFGVLVPSCSRSDDTTTQPSASSQSANQGLVHAIGKKKAEKQAEVETANQVGSLETSDTHVQALVTLLGEEETAKLIAQAKTNPDALWIAAHPDAYAFDGIEIQYKILKLAADEPAAIPYVREFPAKYPAADAVADKDLAMDVASPSSAVPTTSIPHLYQWDRRWAYTIFSSASFGLTGCGPTSLAMVYQGLNRTVDRTPHDMAVLAEERGYMSEFNGTDSSFFIDMAPELGLSCWDAYPDEATIRDELKQGHVIVANLGPGFFTTNGHFFVLAGLDGDDQVIVNDPYSVARSSQTWDIDFIASETMAMFVFAKA